MWWFPISTHSSGKYWKFPLAKEPELLQAVPLAGLCCEKPPSAQLQQEACEPRCDVALKSYRSLSLRNNGLLVPVQSLAATPSRENSSKQLHKGERSPRHGHRITWASPFHRWFPAKAWKPSKYSCNLGVIHALVRGEWMQSTLWYRHRREQCIRMTNVLLTGQVRSAQNLET